MAIAFAEVKTHNRQDGHSAVAAAAYRTRSHMRDHRTGEIHDYRDRADDLEYTSLIVPHAAQGWLDAHRDAGWSEEDIRSLLWNEAEQAESRFDARVSRDLTVAMPWELTLAQRARVSHEIARIITDGHEFTYKREWMQDGKRYSEIVPMQGHGIAVEYSLHRPHEFSEDLNYHTHFQLSVRRMSETGFTEKARELDNKHTSGPHIESWRQSIGQIINRALERAGYDESRFIDMRSYERQGIDKEAQLHMGPEAAHLERSGIRTEVGNHNRTVKEVNAARAREERRARLNDKANVIDFEEKMAMRDARAHAETVMRRKAVAEGRMRKELQKQKQIEEELKRKREIREEEERRREDHARDEQEQEYDREAQEVQWQMDVVDAAIAHDETIRTPAHQWQIAAVEPDRERQDALQAARDKEAREATVQKQIREFQDQTPAEGRPEKIWPAFKEAAADKLPDDTRLRDQWDDKAYQPGKQRAELEEWANQFRSANQSHMHYERIEMDARHGREKDKAEQLIVDHYSRTRLQDERKIREIEERMKRGGPLYERYGKSRDEKDLDAYQKNVENSLMREVSVRGQYEKAHQGERDELQTRYEATQERAERRIEEAIKAERIPNDLKHFMIPQYEPDQTPQMKPEIRPVQRPAPAPERSRSQAPSQTPEPSPAPERNQTPAPAQLPAFLDEEKVSQGWQDHHAKEQGKSPEQAQSRDRSGERLSC